MFSFNFCLFLLVLGGNSAWFTCEGEEDCLNEVHTDCNGCDPDCAGLRSCNGVTMTCTSGTCDITCRGEDSCSNMEITILSNATVNIYCTQTISCQYVTWHINGSLNYECVNKAEACKNNNFTVYSGIISIDECGTGQNPCHSSVYTLYNSIMTSNDNRDSSSYVYLFGTSVCQNCDNNMNIISLANLSDILCFT